jgi:ribonuclease J
VWDLVCEFERKGIDVHVGATDPSIHVSGHACRDEQSRMIEWIQPRAFTPIHGSYHHLMQHAKLARKLGVRNVELVENGQTLLLDSHGLVPGATVRVGRVHIDGGEEVPSETLRERALMAESGAMFVTVPVTAQWRLDGAVNVHSRGVLASADTIGRVREAVERAVREHPSVEPRPTADSVKDVARRAARRLLPGPTMVIAIEER